MIPNLSLTTSGLLDPRVLDVWTREKRVKVRVGVARAMKEDGPRFSGAVNAQVRQSFKTQSRGFANQFKARIYDSKPDRLPMMLVRSRVPWMGLYTRGGTIRGPLLIPLNQAKRIRTDHFRRIVQQLIASGNAFFKNVNGKVILFAENIGENRGATSRFTRPLRKGLGGGRIKRGAEIPIAILVPRVEVKKRLDLPRAVRTRLPGLARLIEQRITQG